MQCRLDGMQVVFTMHTPAMTLSSSWWQWLHVFSLSWGRKSWHACLVTNAHCEPPVLLLLEDVLTVLLSLPRWYQGCHQSMRSHSADAVAGVVTVLRKARSSHMIKLAALKVSWLPKGWYSSMCIVTDCDIIVIVTVIGIVIIITIMIIITCQTC